MKNCKWGFAAVTLVAMMSATSCANESVIEKSAEANRLDFGVRTGKQTISRAAEINTGSIQTAATAKGADAVKVDSYYTTTAGYATIGDKFRGIDVWWNSAGSNGSGAWEHDGPAYHPQSALSHWAVYPNDATFNKVINGTATSMDIVYTVPAPEDQKDLLAATTTTQNSAGNSAANLNFKHLLSQVNFAIQGQENVTISVSGITINGIKSKGTYTMSDTGAGSWALDATATENYTYKGEGVTTGDDTDIKYLTSAGAAPSVAGNTHGLMLMPQTFTAGAGTLSFYYTVSDKVGGFVVDSGNITGMDIASFFTTGTPEWVAGKRYLYVLNFQGPQMLTFSVSVSDWTDADNAIVPQQ